MDSTRTRRPGRSAPRHTTLTRTALTRTALAPAALVAALGLVLGACAPGPAPVTPTWPATVQSWSSSPTDPYDVVLTGTSTQWWATVEHRPAGGPTASATLRLYPRSGPGGAPAATPTQSIPVADGTSVLAMSENVLALRSRNPLANLDVVDLYRRDGATGLWTYGATVPRGLDPTRIVTLSVSDTELVIGDSTTTSLGTGDGRVIVVPLTVTPTSLTAAWLSSQVLVPEPTWTDTDRLGFGRAVAVEGDTLIVSGGSDHVRIHRRVGGVWTTETTLTDPRAPVTDGRFGRSVAVDVTGATARVLVGRTGGFSGFFGPLEPGQVDLYERGAGGWYLRSVIAPAGPDLLDALGVGNEVALDGNRAVVGYDVATVPGAGGSGTTDDYRLSVYRIGTGVTLETTLSFLDAAGGPRPGQTQTAPLWVDLAGSHVTAVSVDSLSSGSRFSAVSFDRQPAG